MNPKLEQLANFLTPLTREQQEKLTRAVPRPGEWPESMSNEEIAEIRKGGAPVIIDADYPGDEALEALRRLHVSWLKGNYQRPD